MEVDGTQPRIATLTKPAAGLGRVDGSAGASPHSRCYSRRVKAGCGMKGGIGVWPDAPSASQTPHTTSSKGRGALWLEEHVVQRAFERRREIPGINQDGSSTRKGPGFAGASNNARAIFDEVELRGCVDLGAEPV